MAEKLAIRVKVCGLTRAEDVRAAASAGCDAVGVVGWTRSPRAVAPERAAELLADLEDGVLPVAVLVDCAPREAERWLTASGARAVQLCGREDPAAWRGFAHPILRRVAVDERAEEELARWTGVAELFVLDHPARPGGSGLGVDLDLAARLCARGRCLLAGGLDAQVVAAAIARARPAGVDASSRLESAPGIKDAARVAAFVRAARAALAEVSA